VLVALVVVLFVSESAVKERDGAVSTPVMTRLVAVALVAEKSVAENEDALIDPPDMFASVMLPPVIIGEYMCVPCSSPMALVSAMER
jgi:hypothetical protein